MSIDRVLTLTEMDTKKIENAARWGQSLLREGLELKSITGPYVNEKSGKQVFIAHCDRFYGQQFGRHLRLDPTPTPSKGRSIRPDPLPVSGKGE